MSERESALGPGPLLEHLIARGLLASRAVLERRVVVVDVSRRNLAFQVLRRGRPGYLVKQAVDAEARQSLAREAATYRLLHGRGQARGIAARIPRLLAHDHGRSILVLELFEKAETLGTRVRRLRRPSRHLARSLGAALAALHGLPVGRGSAWAGLKLDPPWILSFHRPGAETLRDVSSANLELLRLIQSSGGLCAALDRLRESWRPLAPIHNDVRWDNCLVCHPGGAARRPELKLVDWELAGVGDPGWDVGSVLAQHLSLWTLSIPPAAEVTAHVLRRARLPLGRLRPAVGDLLRAYVRHAGLRPADVIEGLPRAVEFAAARLVQEGFERLQDAMRPSPSSLRLLRLAENLVRDPTRAGRELLGLGDIGT